LSEQAVAEAREETARIAWEAAKQAEHLAEEARQAADARATRALGEQREIAANSWRATADSMSARAEELLKVGLVDEATALCQHGLHNDPGNLRLHLVKAAVLFSVGDLTQFDIQMKKVSAMIAGGVSGAVPETVFTGILTAGALNQAAGSLKPLVRIMFTRFGKRVHENEAKELVKQLHALGWTDEIVDLVADGTLPPCAVGPAINGAVAEPPAPNWVLQVARHWLRQFSVASNVASLPWEDRIVMLDYLYFLLQRGTDIDPSRVENTVVKSLTLENARSEYLRDFIHNAWPLSRYRLSLVKASAFTALTQVSSPAKNIRDRNVPREFDLGNHLGEIALTSVIIGCSAFLLVGFLIEKWMPLLFVAGAAVAVPIVVLYLQHIHNRRRADRVAQEWVTSVNTLNAELAEQYLRSYVEVHGTTPSEEGAPQLRVRDRSKAAADALLQARRLATRPEQASARPEVRALLESAAANFEAASEWAGTGSSLILLARTYDPSNSAPPWDTAKAIALYLKAAESFQSAGTNAWREDALKAAAKTRETAARRSAS
jgi:hypothetical protein